MPLLDLKRLFQKADITVESYIDITKGDLATALAEWITSSIVVAAIGGDGTIASVANIVAGHEAIFAPLPGGTLNHFTKDAGITQDLEQAIRNLKTATPRKVDISRVNGRVFLNNSSIGIYPVSLQTRKRFEDHLGKWPAAIVASIRAFVRFRLYTVTIEGHTFSTPFIFVGNNTYHFEHGAERRSLNEGKLCVYTIRSNKRLTLFRLLFAAIARRLHHDDDFVESYPQSITIHAKQSKVSVSTDGEVFIASTPLHYECNAGGIIIIGN